MNIKPYPPREPKFLNKNKGVIIRVKELFFTCQASELNDKLLEYAIDIAGRNE